MLIFQIVLYCPDIYRQLLELFQNYQETLCTKLVILEPTPNSIGTILVLFLKSCKKCSSSARFMTQPFLWNGICSDQKEKAQVCIKDLVHVGLCSVTLLLQCLVIKTALKNCKMRF